MKYQTERIENLAQSQTLLAELFTYVGENFDQAAQLRDSWVSFFRLWADQDPYTKIKVFTSREESKLQGVVMALVIANPLFVTKPHIHKFIDLHQNDKAFQDYVDVVLGSL